MRVGQRFVRVRTKRIKSCILTVKPSCCSRDTKSNHLFPKTASIRAAVETLKNEIFTWLNSICAEKASDISSIPEFGGPDHLHCLPCYIYRYLSLWRLSPFTTQFTPANPRKLFLSYRLLLKKELVSTITPYKAVSQFSWLCMLLD